MKMRPRLVHRVGRPVRRKRRPTAAVDKSPSCLKHKNPDTPAPALGPERRASPSVLPKPVVMVMAAVTAAAKATGRMKRPGQTLN
jgi:hypothetical protein